ncbi:MAG: leucyl/phenylalanyl-tRNA--protein transferase [Chitinophagales bacterium]
MTVLTHELWFPDPDQADEEGLLAIGGDLSPERLLLAYQKGIFPWFMEDGIIFWFCPPRRMVLFPKELHISKSMKEVLRSKKFRVTENEAFKKVIQMCAKVHARTKSVTWISDEFIAAYSKLHQQGHALSIEVWENDYLSGGLYGVVVGNIFCGESMFSLVPNSSKVALIEICRSEKYSHIDCQVVTNHLTRMGARNISRNAYLKLLEQASSLKPKR